MAQSFARRLAIFAILAGLVLAWPTAAVAIVNGGCTAEGHTSSGSSVDITTEDVWHVKSTDVAGGSGSAPGPMQRSEVGAYALGILIPIARGQGTGSTSGDVSGIELSTLSKLGKVFVVGGNASGDGGSCDGQILVIVDDVDALFTILGGGGLAAAVVGLAIMIASARGQGCLTKILGTFGGGLAGVGLALAAEQFEIFQPTTYIGMAIAIIGALLGFLVAGRLAAARAPVAPPPAATPRPPVPPTTSTGVTPPASPPPAAPTPPATAPSEGDTGQDFGKFMERAETGDPETASFLEEVGGPGVVGAAPAAAAPPPPPASAPPASTPPTPAATTDETQGFVDGVVAPAADEAGPPSIPFGKPPAPPTEDQKLIEGVFPSDTPAKPPAQPPDGPTNDGESHPADDYGPENRPVGGGGPM